MALTIDTKNLSKDTLDKLKTATLNDNVAYLCTYLDYDHHYIMLRDQKVLTQRDDEEIKAKVTRADKIFEMVDRLTKKDPRAFNILCRSIMKANQEFVVEKLIKAYQAKIDKESIDQMLFGGSDDEYNHDLKIQVSEIDTSTLPRPGDPGTPALPVRTLNSS